MRLQGQMFALVLSLTLTTGCQPEARSGASDGPSDAATASDETPAASGGPTQRERASRPIAPAAPNSSHAPTGALLVAASGGDGDSWKDTAGVEYRLGLVNAPELSECYGGVASAKRKELTAPGFRATSYAVDSYGRRVAVVYLRDGRNLNVWLAAHGYADDKYLSKFRHENAHLAEQLDDAFAAAKRNKVGLWSACHQAARAQPIIAARPARRCDPSYPSVCIPSAPPDLDCPDVTFRRFVVRAPDPHLFDSDRDGIGCETG